jgi:hypothetical protein
MASSKRSRDLVEAAEALTHAALSESKTSSLAVGREAVASLIALKESMGKKLHDVNESILTMTSEV